MRMNDLNSCFGNAAPTSEQKQRMLGTILEGKLENGGIDTMGRGTRRLATVVALVAVLVLMASTALAVGLGWHERFMEYFGIGDTQTGLLDGAVGSPGLSVTDNGVTVNVLQTLADSQGVYVVFEATVPNNVELADETGFSVAFLEAETVRQVGYASSVSGCEILDISGNKIIAIADFFPSERIRDGTLKLTVQDVGYTTHEEGSTTFKTLISGDWSLEWDFTYKDTSKKISPNQAVDADGEAVVTEISISPVSVCVIVEGSMRAKLEGLLDNAEVMVTLKDSSTIMYSFRDENALYSSHYVNDGGVDYRYRMCNRFDRIIDPDDVVSVTLCGIMIPIG